MNKKRIDSLLPKAYDILSELNISENGIIKNAYRSQICAFGAAITMGSLLSAVAFFSQKGNCSVDRHKLMSAIKKLSGFDGSSLFEYVKNNNTPATKQLVLESAIALKLAMNLYTIEK